MPRIIGIDYGLRRTGIATTDPLKIIASPLTTIETNTLLDFLKDYCEKEAVEAIVVGLPLKEDGTPGDILPQIETFVLLLKQTFPNILIEMFDERYSSRIAYSKMLEIGLKKSDRRDKGRIDRIAAAVILEDYLKSKGIF